MDIASLSLCNLLLNREICRSHIMDIVPFLCFHHFTDGHSLSLSLCSLSLSCNLLSIRKNTSCIMDNSTTSLFSPFHWMDIASLPLSLSMQSPIDREICRSCIMEIVPFLCFHHFMDGHSLSLSLSLSIQSPINREICRSHITEDSTVSVFSPFHRWT